MRRPLSRPVTARRGGKRGDFPREAWGRHPLTKELQVPPWFWETLGSARPSLIALCQLLEQFPKSRLITFAAIYRAAYRGSQSPEGIAFAIFGERFGEDLLDHLEVDS